jgi:hypothetical protein
VQADAGLWVAVVGVVRSAFADSLRTLLLTCPFVGGGVGLIAPLSLVDVDSE